MRKRVLLINWDNYPNISSGGVYTWAKTLVSGLADWNFAILNQLSNANTNSDYTVPTNVYQVIEVPIYGTSRVEEYSLGKGILFEKVIRTTDSAVRKYFLPLFSELLKDLLAENSDAQRLASNFNRLYLFFTIYDWKKCFEHPTVLERFLAKVRSDPLYSNLKISEALAPFEQLLKRGLQILAIRFPVTDIVHCSNSWLPALIAIPAKMNNESAVIITEHGIAFKEMNLYINAALRTTAARMLWKIVTRNVIRAMYSVADRIISVSASNTIWQTRLGADSSKIRVVHNGVDTKKFRPIENVGSLRAPILNGTNRPIVVSVGRVDFFKDIQTLVAAIRYVRDYVPEVLCLHYGSGFDLDYTKACARAVKEFQLEDNFRFMGVTGEPEKAFNIADVVALSSITEGFPYTAIEAMACGKAVVAADVGGVRESLEGCGVLVKSRSPSSLGHGILLLLRDYNLRTRLEDAALRRANTEFTLERCVEQYRMEYNQLLEKLVNNLHLTESNRSFEEGHRQAILQ